MDYSILKAEYVSAINACDKTLERLEEERYQVISMMAELDHDYELELENLGLRKGGKVEVRFPNETDLIRGYIEEVKVFSNGNVELQVHLPGQRGQRLKKAKDFYTGVKVEWVTILPDDYIFGAN
jgi:hypothetical protein